MIEIEFVVQATILVTSLALLAKAGHFTIKSVEDLIELTRLSEVSAGFAILSIVTSLPEMTVAVFSIIYGTPGITVGDILGSNVFNIGIVVGVIALMNPLKECCTDRMVELVDILFLSSLIPILLVIFKVLSPLVGAILLGIFVYSIYRMTRRRNQVFVGKKSQRIEKNRKIILVKMIGGIVAVILASRFVVVSASAMATFLGIPMIIMGAKIVALGTSLPELILDVTAVRRGRVRLAIGDAIGSNLTNLTLVLGTVLLLSPFAVNLTVFTETLPFLLITSLILWRFLVKGGVPPWGGVLLIMIYVLFQAIL